MYKLGGAVGNKFCTMSVCNFRESLTLRRLNESKEK